MKKIKRSVKLSKKAGSLVAKYKGKDWELEELLEFMAARIKDLERHQCKPTTKCLFEGREYLDDKYIGTNLQTEFFYYG